MKKKKASGGPTLAAADQAAVEQAVSRKLRDYYDQISKQEVPRHLVDLLDQLASGSQTKEQKQ